MKTRYAAALVLAALSAGPAFAHHAGAMFDATKTVTVSGTVKDFQWANPHAWIHVLSPGASGAEEWTMECSAINIIARKGWKSSSLKPGDKVVLSVHPAKDGSKAGLVLNVKLPSGEVLPDHDY